MMKLKNLFDNRPLAEMILSNWEFNPKRMDLLDHYRISANAIYPFEMNGTICFLRFTPENETSEAKIRAELAFLKYLRLREYPTPESILSKKGEELINVNTPWGRYYAVVFQGVPGERVDRISLSDVHMLNLGMKLGYLHRLSKEYQCPQFQRNTWQEQLCWMERVLSRFPQENAAREEVQRIGESLKALPIHSGNYGLIHYDFEPDNLFYDEASNMFYPIDFDDSVYHWFVMDIEQALDSIKEDLDLPSDEIQRLSQRFIEGYRRVMPIDEEMLGLMPLFQRYANLYGYVRILRSVEEKWENEPEWMVSLRGHLEELMRERRRYFGQPVV